MKISDEELSAQLEDSIKLLINDVKSQEILYVKVQL